MILISSQPERKALQKNLRIRLKNSLSFLRTVRLNHLFQNNLPQIQLRKVKQSMDSKPQQEWFNRKVLLHKEAIVQPKT